MRHLLQMLLLLAAAGCGRTDPRSGEAVELDFAAAPVDAPADVADALSDARRIALRTRDKADLLARVDKVVATDGALYLGDYENRRIVCYDTAGNPLRALNRIGRGPGEYLNLSDFCLDPAGNLYLEDARLNKIMRYDADFNFVEEYPLSYDIDALERLDDGHFLAVLSPWNGGAWSGIELARLDERFALDTVLLRYDAFVDPQFVMADNLLSPTSEGFSFHYTIDDRVFELDRRGNIVREYRFDLGERRVRDRERQQIEKYFDELGKRTYLSGRVAVCAEFIYGSLVNRWNPAQFIWSRRDGRVRIDVFEAEGVPAWGTFCGTCGDRIYAWLPPEEEHADDCSLVLCSYRMR